jgi:hypothetical protein
MTIREKCSQLVLPTVYNSPIYTSILHVSDTKKYYS